MHSYLNLNSYSEAENELQYAFHYSYFDFG